jgi:ribokinase
MEVPLSASLAAARRVKAAGGVVILDPAPAPKRPYSAEVYSLIDIITPNEVETAALVGSQPASAEDGLRAASALVEKGVKIAVVKLGARGVCVKSPGFEGFIPPFKVNPIDTVAAGDCFNGGLAHALHSSMGLADAVRFAAACGALSTTRKGAAAAAPSLPEVEALLQGQGRHT